MDRNLAVLSFIFLIFRSAPVLPWDRNTVAYSGAGVGIEPVLPDEHTHLIPEQAGGPELVLRLTGGSGDKIAGAFLYVGITDYAGRGRGDFTRRLDFQPGTEAREKFRLDFLDGQPGFYDIRALLFDHGRELGRKEFTFGYAVDKLPLEAGPPQDFDRFWQDTRDSLSRIPLDPRAQMDSTRSSAEVKVYRVSFASLHGARIHGWLAVPRRQEGPHAALLLFPGYSTGKISPNLEYPELGYVTLSIQVRGYGVDQESYPEDNRQYMTLGVENPETYIYREIVCHCLRAVDFLAARPEVDSGRLGAVGGSQGGGLSILTAGLDQRIKVVVASAPFLTGFPLAMTMTGAPYRDLVRYLELHPECRERVLRTVSFFDSANLAGRITVPVILAIGLADRTCPAPAIYRMYLGLGAKTKKVEIFPGLDHLEIWKEFAPLARQWLLEHLPPVD